MSQHATKLWSLIVFLFIFPQLALSQQRHAVHFTAKMYLPDSKDVLYIEEFQEFIKDGQLVGAKSIYKRPTGEIIITKEVTFGRDLSKAEFRLEDLRDGYLEAVELRKKKLKIITIE